MSVCVCLRLIIKIMHYKYLESRQRKRLDKTPTSHYYNRISKEAGHGRLAVHSL
ncbi:hypothetical protein GLYMA_15G221500v4 [Glycine max]|uniref:Uncharacterized protein n=1 Tax=Glycine max TaxID=3847 RepID=A0A0R0G541_SOYBN|nr:hypothetical protein GYH30_043146 [Glycine max]KRH13191.1 hypothetical protein GLYMA_15G221500v4 [Glycine max]